MSNFSKVSVGISTKRYTHDMSFDNNTTMSIGVVQPLLSQYLQPGDKVSCNLKQLVRLSPMPVPSFARLSLVNKVKFVPMSSVFPGYDCLMSGQAVYPSSHASYIPTSVPLINNKFLVWVLCNLADTRMCVFSAPSNSDTFSAVASSSPLALLKQNVFKSYLSFTNTPAGAGAYDTTVTFDNADFIFKFVDASTIKIVCVRLGRLGRILRAGFVGLGYDLSPVDEDDVSLLPILALYKAYFDSYAPLS